MSENTPIIIIDDELLQVWNESRDSGEDIELQNSGVDMLTWVDVPVDWCE